jgi:integrase
LAHRRGPVELSQGSDRFQGACHNELDVSKLLKRFKAAVIRSGIRETEKRIYKASQGATVEREFTNVKWHDLRHAFATFCAAQGIPMRTIQEWIGHEDFETLRIYMHYAPSGFEVDLLNRAIEQEKAGGVGAPQIAPNLKPGGRG